MRAASLLLMLAVCAASVTCIPLADDPSPSPSPSPSYTPSSSSSYTPEPTTPPSPSSSSYTPEPTTPPAPFSSSSSYTPEPEPTSSSTYTPPSSSYTPEPSSSSYTPEPEPTSSSYIPPIPSSSLPPVPPPSSSTSPPLPPTSSSTTHAPTSSPHPEPTPFPESGEYFLSLFSSFSGEGGKRNSDCRFQTTTDSLTLERISDTKGRCELNERRGLYYLLHLTEDGEFIKALKALCGDDECRDCGIEVEEIYVGECGSADVEKQVESMFLLPASHPCVGILDTQEVTEPDDFVLIDYDDDNCNMDYTASVYVADLGPGDGQCRLSVSGAQTYNRVTVDKDGTVTASVGCTSNTCDDIACEHVSNWKAGACHGSFTLSQFKNVKTCKIQPVVSSSKTTAGQIAGAVIGSLLAVGLAAVLYAKYIKRQDVKYTPINTDDSEY